MRRHVLHPVLAALALLYLAAMVVSGAMPVQRQLVRFEAKGVLKLPPEEVTRVELSRGTQRVTLLRAGETEWATPDGVNIGAAGRRVSKAVQIMHNSGPVREIEARGAGGERPGAVRPRPAAALREALRRGRRAGSRRPLRRVQPRGVPPVHAHRRQSAALPHVPLRRRRMGRGHDRSGRAMTPHVSRRRAAPWAALALLLLLAPAQGHIAGSMGYATVSLYGGTVRYSLTLGPDALAAAGGEAAAGARPTPRGGYDALADLVARKVAISADGVRCEPVPGTVTPPTPDRANAVVTVDYACPGTPRELVLRDDLSDALGNDYHTLVRVEALGSVQQYTLEPDQREARVAVATPTGGGAPEVTAGSGVFAFLPARHRAHPDGS